MPMNDHPSNDVKGMIAAMSFEDIVEFLSGVADNLTVPACTALTQRLYEIVLYDNYVPDEHRKEAWALLSPLKASVETALEDKLAARYIRHSTVSGSTSRPCLNWE
jgi:hypothetical protein